MDKDSRGSICSFQKEGVRGRGGCTSQVELALFEWIEVGEGGIDQIGCEAHFGALVAYGR